MKKGLIVTGIIILVLIVSMSIANIVSVKPYVFIFRSAINMRGEEVNLGNYTEEISKVEELDFLDLEVNNQPNVQATFYKTKSESKPQPLILFIHGGGWTGGSAESISSYAKLLASNGYVVANVDYALAPEYPYPASTMQLVELINYIYQNASEYGIDKDSIFIGGNSAGAHLSSQLADIITNEKYKDELGVSNQIPASSLKGLILLNGVYDFSTVEECNFPGFEKYAWAYTGQKDWQNFDDLDQMSPINFINKDFPRSFISAGDIDPLAPQSKEFESKLKMMNIKVDSLYWETGHGLNHDYMFDLTKEESITCYERIVAFLNANK